MRKIALLFIILFNLVGLIGCTKNNQNDDSKEEEKYYTVMFNSNGGTLVEGEYYQIVKENESAIPPVYERKHYVFAGWDTEFDNVKSDLVVTAIWEVEIKKMRNIKSNDLIKEMRAGWNLGNTFDAPGETLWGNPRTTKEMIDFVKAAGFNVIRIPVTWEGHFNIHTYQIDSNYLNRVQEVVDYAIDGKTFVIINMHHERWNDTTYENQELGSLIMEKLWTQIAIRFQGYDEHLIFEGMNEPRKYNASSSIQWGGDKETFDVINHFNQVFVDTIRKAPGNNKKRHLMITTCGGGISTTLAKNLKLIDDDYVIVSIHSYAPYNFAHDYTTETTFDKFNPKDTVPIDSALDIAYNYWIKNGQAVIIGEYASRDKKNLEARLEWLEYYLEKATNYGIPCIWWDTGQAVSDTTNTFAIFNRRKLEWYFPEIVEKIMEITESRK